MINIPDIYPRDFSPHKSEIGTKKISFKFGGERIRQIMTFRPS